MKVMYFSYGSGMHVDQMSRRISSAKRVGPVRLPDNRFLFNKRSADGSGKANLVESPGEVAWGVLYEIHRDDLDILDQYEIGYHRIGVCVYAGKEPFTAYTHVSTNLTDRPRPFRWYKGMILSGALVNDLPEDYVEYLKSTQCVDEA